MAKIKLNNNEYPIPDSTLSNLKADFIAYLRSIAGSGMKVVVGGVEYSVDSTKVQDAVSGLGDAFENLQSGGSNVLPAGLYDANDVLVASWEELGIDITHDFTAIDKLLNPTLLHYNKLNSYPNGVKLVIPEGVTHIGSFALYNCTNLTSIIIPDSVTSIGIEGVFQGCTSLTSITIPNSPTIIEGYAFADCSSLISITIPNSVTTIREFAFNACSSLIDVYFTGTEEEWNAISIGSNNDFLTNATIHYNYVAE